MSVTVVIGKRHLLAGLSVLILTALIGAALVIPAVSDATTTYLTRSASCAGVNFYASDSTDTYGTNGARRWNNGDASETFQCNADLPTGAIVTKVQFNVANAAQCFLTRVSFGLAPTYDHMASVTHGNGAPAVLTTTNISHATVDNANFGYVLECGLDPDGYLYGADVIYKITAAKG